MRIVAGSRMQFLSIQAQDFIEEKTRRRNLIPSWENS